MNELEKLAAVTRETFLPHVGSVYRVTDDAGNTGEVVLYEVTAGHLTWSGATRAPFSLLFLGPHDLTMTQGTYRFEGPDGETLLIFVVPVGPPANREGLLYQAIFN